MKLKLMQHSVGNFNLLSSEKSLEFSMGIYEDGKIVTEDGISAKISYSGEADEYDEFKDPFNNMEFIIDKCVSYCMGVISSVPYEKQAFLFCKVYQDNLEEINKNLSDERRIEINKNIERLNNELSLLDRGYPIIPDLYYEINRAVNRNIDKYTKFLESSISELEQIKEGTDKYNETQKRIDGYQNKIDYYKSKLTTSVFD